MHSSTTNCSNVEEDIDEALQLLQETKAMVPKSKLKEGILEVEKQMKLSWDLIATFRMATGGANLSAKMSFVESGGPSMLFRLPTRRAPSEKVKTFTVSVPPKDTDDDPTPTQLTYTEETTAMENNQCPCGLVFNTRADLNTHIVGHKPTNWNCSKCPKIYYNRGVLYKHFREKHQGVFQYNCSDCEYGNDEKARFAHHMYHKHNVEINGIVKCPSDGCGYVAPQKCILVSHVENCGEDKQNKKHKCTQSEKGYRSKKYLRLHMASDHPGQHDNVRQYPCTFPGCEKIYKSPDTLRNHRKIKTHFVV